MHRPKLVEFEGSAPYFAWITTDLQAPLTGRPWLQLGSESPEDGDMSFLVKVKSDFGGSMRWTQLIQQYRYRDDYPVGWWTKNSAGQFWADGAEFYLPETLNVNVEAHQLSPPLVFGDGPGNPVGIHLTESHDTFKTYARFRPVGDESIWVTLGRVDWDWSATAVNPSGWPYDALPNSWTITDSSVFGPDLHEDDSFPFWLGITTSFGE